MELHRVGIVMAAFSGTCLRGRIVNSGARLVGEKPNKEPTLTRDSLLVSGGKPGSTSSHHDSTNRSRNRSKTVLHLSLHRNGNYSTVSCLSVSNKGPGPTVPGWFNDGKSCLKGLTASLSWISKLRLLFYF